MSVDTGTREIRMTPEFLAELDERRPGRHRPERVGTRLLSAEQIAAVRAATPAPEAALASVPVPLRREPGQRSSKLRMLKANLRGIRFGGRR